MKKRIYTVLATYLVSLLLMVIQKPLFLIWFADKADGVTLKECFLVLWHGLILDSTVAGYLTVIPWLLIFATIWIKIPERIVTKSLKYYFMLITLFVSLIVSVDIGLFKYWDFRLDSTILHYIVTPQEATASVTWSDALSVIFIFCGYGALMWFMLRQIYLRYHDTIIVKARRWLYTLYFILIGGLTFLAIRGSIGHAVANVSMVYFSNNGFLNQAATNPVFSFLSSAFRSELNEDDYQFYAETERKAIFDELYSPTSSHAECDTLLNNQRPNVVLVILESFGRNITDEKVGEEYVTPNIQALKNEGIWFENIIANSFRTDRGQVSVMSGWPAHPVVSVMKYPLKARSLPSIANTLKQEGYSTSFTYGGDANFTNTRAYLFNTGIDDVYDEKVISLSSEHRTTLWGYNDKAMCQYFTQQVLDFAHDDKPFFATLLTLSSHEPFSVPHDHFSNKILNSTHFTDKYVGQMIRSWQASPAWDNMLVILIADHGMPYPEGVPTGALSRQRIPMLWLGGAIKQPCVIETYGSQSDMAATLLAQMGIEYENNPFSRDILNPNIAHFGFWTYNNAFGMIDEQGYVIYNCTGERVTEQEGDTTHTDTLLEQGKAILQTLHTDLCNR
ncbi:MAG: sulfatase-like hydrolase/transferase [Alistipes sp.]|nr:sulfatase-like hydrolase/transferase [Alistipes sp.]